MPKERLELSRPRGSVDFESTASTVPPLGHTTLKFEGVQKTLVQKTPPSLQSPFRHLRRNLPGSFWGGLSMESKALLNLGQNMGNERGAHNR